MKTLYKRLSVAVFVSLFTFIVYSQEFKKIPASEVNMNKVKIAEDFALRFMTAMTDSTYYEFKSDEAIGTLQNALSKDAQMALHSQLKGQFGEFQGAEYDGAWQQSDNINMLLVRFKSNFSLSNKKMEIRVVLDNEDKIAGFWIFPWSDALGR